MLPTSIFPASGALATSTILPLLTLIPPHAHNSLTLISRTPSNLPPSLTATGARTATASYDSATSLRTALAGAKVLFLISYPSHVHHHRTRLHLAAIDAARDAGATHVFYSSLAYARERDTESRAVVMRAHLDTEAHLARCAAESGGGFTYTVLREGLYSESWPIYTSFFDLRDPSVTEVRAPHDGAAPGVAWVKRDELGEASAKLIAAYAEDPGRAKYVNEIVLLTGARVWTLAETVGVLAKAAGRELGIVEVGVDEYAGLPRNLEAFGGEEEMVRSWATAFEAIKAGECAVVRGDLEEILGREPEAFDVTVERGGEWQGHG